MKGRGGARQPLSVKRPGATRGKAAAPAQVAGKPGIPKASSKSTGSKQAAARGAGSGPPAVERPGARTAKRSAMKAAETGARPRKTATRDAAVAAARTARKRETAEARRARAAEIYARLERAHPDAHCELDFRDPFELLVATILSAQCTDKRVNMTTPALFAEFPDARALATAPRERLEELVKSTGFFRNKAKSLLGMAGAVVEQHGGAIPDAMDALVALPGVGRKTANVILGNAFGRNEGVVVDTHVTRVAGRLGLTAETDPVKIEQDLAALFPRERWTMLAHLLIFHGRRICEARVPKCERCPLAELCPSSRV